MRRLRKLCAVAVFAVAAVGVSAGSAFAGEVTGNGDETPIRHVARSICAFSGLNDGEPPPGRTAPHVQNWGQTPKAERDFLTTIGVNPGEACNGHTGFLSGGH
jgi:hypothetical protein